MAKSNRAGQSVLVKGLLDNLKLQHKLHKEYQAQLRELTDFAKELKTVQDDLDNRIKINNVKRKIKDL